MEYINNTVRRRRGCLTPLPAASLDAGLLMGMCPHSPHLNSLVFFCRPPLVLSGRGGRSPPMSLLTNARLCAGHECTLARRLPFLVPRSNSLAIAPCVQAMAARSRGGNSMAMTACFAGPLFNMLVRIIDCHMFWPVPVVRRVACCTCVGLRLVPSGALGCTCACRQPALHAVARRACLPPRQPLLARSAAPQPHPARNPKAGLWPVADHHA